MELQNLFTMVINMTATATIVILCVLLARLALRNAPRVFSCVLWLVVLFRLLCPVSVSGPISVLELVDAPRAESGTVEYVEPPVRSPLETIHVEAEQIGVGEVVESIPVQTVPPIDWNFLGSWVWLAAALGFLGYGAISYVNFRRKLRVSVPLEPGVREADGIGSPFVLGRTIYLPAGLKGEERDYILLHERLHLRHGDPVVKALFWLAACIHWFNPLVWLAFFLCGRDMELRCDEAVLKRLGGQIRSDYAQSLLDLAVGRQFAPVPLAFGEGDTGKRVRFVLKWKKTKLWMTVAAAVFCAMVLMLTACDPAAPGESDSPFGYSYRLDGVYASAEYPADMDGDTIFTLTSDMGLLIRSSKTELPGFFRESVVDTEVIRSMQETVRQKDIRRSWSMSVSEWWLLELKNGELWLFDGAQCVMYRLSRTNLLGVSVKPADMEECVEPVWLFTDTWDWIPEKMVNSIAGVDAQIILQPERDTDMIMVSEEYFELQSDGEFSIITSDHCLERDENGCFVLNVSHRGSYCDFAIYRVTVGEDSYEFRLPFLVASGDDHVSVGVVEESRQVRYEENGAFITLSIPKGWGYAITTTEDEEFNAGIAGGITFWPLGREEGKVFFGYYPDRFAVCGTGLESDAMVLAGQKVSVGTYDDHAIWDFISFGEYFAVWGQGHEAWWAEYGDTAMMILDTAQFGN